MKLCNSVNVKLSDSQLEKLNSTTKKGAVTLRLPINLIGNGNNDTNFLIKLSIPVRQVSNIRKEFANNFAINIKPLRTGIFKTTQSSGFKHLKPLMKTGLP